MKKYENENFQFTGTDSRSWYIHLNNVLELAETHDVTRHDILFQLIRWTVGPGPKMVRDNYKKSANSSWVDFLRLMDSKYCSEIPHACI